jgi:hypothetical protein
LIVHLKENKISETFLVKPPRGTQTCNSTTDDHDRVLRDLLGLRKVCMIAQLMAHLE